MKLPRFFDLLHLFNQVMSECGKDLQYFNKCKKNTVMKYYNYQKQKKTKKNFSVSQLKSIFLFFKSFINIRINNFTMLDKNNTKKSVNLYLLKKIHIIYYINQTRQILRKRNMLANRSWEKIINIKSDHISHENDSKMSFVYSSSESPLFDYHIIDRSRRYISSFSNFSLILKFFKLTETSFLLSFQKLLRRRKNIFFWH